MTTIRTKIGERVSRFFFGGPVRNATASAVVDEAPGWGSLTQRPHDYDLATLQELYADALTAWRKNPIAWRIIAITTDYIVGDQIRISSPNRSLAKFISEFWNHPKNAMDSRLEPMSDELARAGDLFIALFRNPQDGMSYLRFVTKDNIVRIETADNDWENELAYTERIPWGGASGQAQTGEERRWLSPTHPEASSSDAIMLHYAVNRPVGALLGESDLTTMIPWLQRYSRMLEDRVRLHWAVRAYLWIVTVPTNLVNAKKEQYRQAPDSGSIIVKDEAEKWEVYSPSLRGADASHDLQAVRGMIDAGSGYPPHWRGEAGEANLATATAMQAPTERHLRRRQQYFMFVLKDILYQAYLRSVEIGRSRNLPGADYGRLFTSVLPEISRSDNNSLAQAAQSLANALAVVRGNLPGRSDGFARLMLRLVLRFAGEPQTDEILDEIMGEAKTTKPKVASTGKERPSHNDISN